MLDVAPTELLLIAIVALLVIGPKDLPKAMRFVGKWVGKARGVARQFRSGFDTMVREAELEEMEKKWAEENARIMREHPVDLSFASPVALPSASDAAASSGAHVANDAVVQNSPDHDPAQDVTPASPDAEQPSEPVMVEKPIVEPAKHPDKADAPSEPAPASDKAPS